MKKYIFLLLFLLFLGCSIYYYNTKTETEPRYIHRSYIGTVISTTDSSIVISDRGTGIEYQFFYGEQTIYLDHDLKPGDEVSIEAEYWDDSEQPFPAFTVHHYPIIPVSSATPSVGSN